MLRRLTLLALSASILISCSKDGEGGEDSLDGTYSLTSVIVNAIDVNGDGTASEDLFDELDCFANASMTSTFEIKGESYIRKGGTIWSPIFDSSQQQLISWDCGPLPTAGGTSPITILSDNSFRIFNEVYVKNGNKLTVENTNYGNHNVPWKRAVFTKQ